jgi:hypothetical protein
MRTLVRGYRKTLRRNPRQPLVVIRNAPFFRVVIAIDNRDSH